MESAANIDWDKASEDFQRDGAVRLPKLLDSDGMAAALAAYEWSLAHPGPLAVTPAVLATPGSKFYSDLSNFAALDAYRDMLRSSPLPDAVAQLWGGSNDVWLLYEQVFLREGAKTQRTPWHQDASYIPIAGHHTAVAWITFDPATKADCLEFVRGSHKGPIYNQPAVEGASGNVDADKHQLGDIEADRGKWDIISWNITPGDVIIFHVNTLHGGSATAGQRRRTLSLRFFGDDAVYAASAAGFPAPMLPGFHERMRSGMPFRDPAFTHLLPR